MYKILSIISHEEIYIKTTMRYYHTPAKMAKILKIDNPVVGKDAEQLDIPYRDDRNAKWCGHIV